MDSVTDKCNCLRMIEHFRKNKHLKISHPKQMLTFELVIKVNLVDRSGQVVLTDKNPPHKRGWVKRTMR